MSYAVPSGTHTSRFKLSRAQRRFRSRMKPNPSPDASLLETELRQAIEQANCGASREPTHGFDFCGDTRNSVMSRSGRFSIFPSCGKKRPFPRTHRATGAPRQISERLDSIIALSEYAGGSNSPLLDAKNLVRLRRLDLTSPGGAVDPRCSAEKQRGRTFLRASAPLNPTFANF